MAVLPFENVTKNAEVDWLSVGIPETITSDLTAVPGLILVERLQLSKVMDEQKLQISGAVDPKTSVAIGKLVGADVMVLGAYQKLGPQIRLLFAHAAREIRPEESDAKESDPDSSHTPQ